MVLRMLQATCFSGSQSFLLKLMCAGQVYVLARLLSNSGRNKLRRGEHCPVGLELQEKAEYGVLVCCHCGVVLSVGLEVTQDWVTAVVEKCPPEFMSN